MSQDIRGGRIYSPHEPVSRVQSVRIQENGEPLVNFLEVVPGLRWADARFNYRREQLVRESVADRLKIAVKELAPTYTLLIVEGWRPLHIQIRGYRATMKRLREQNPSLSETALRRMANNFTAPIHPRVPPPHSSGGAVDVLLGDRDGNEISLMGEFERFATHVFDTHNPQLDVETRKLRQILHDAMHAAGITNYPMEYWHYSYGDQGWAYREGQVTALYGQTQPSEYEPDPEDLSDEPLEVVE